MARIETGGATRSPPPRATVCGQAAKPAAPSVRRRRAGATVADHFACGDAIRSRAPGRLSGAELGDAGGLVLRGSGVRRRRCGRGRRGWGGRRRRRRCHGGRGSRVGRRGRGRAGRGRVARRPAPVRRSGAVTAAATLATACTAAIAASASTTAAPAPATPATTVAASGRATPATGTAAALSQFTTAAIAVPAASGIRRPVVRAARLGGGRLGHVRESDPRVERRRLRRPQERGQQRQRRDRGGDDRPGPEGPWPVDAQLAHIPQNPVAARRAPLAQPAFAL